MEQELEAENRDDIIKLMNEKTWKYADNDTKAVEELEKRISRAGRTERPIQYMDLLEGVPFHIPEVSGDDGYFVTRENYADRGAIILQDYLAFLCVRSYKEHGFLASALVVTKKKGKASWGFCKMARQLGLLSEQHNREDCEKFCDEEQKRAIKEYKRLSEPPPSSPPSPALLESLMSFTITLM